MSSRSTGSSLAYLIPDAKVSVPPVILAAVGIITYYFSLPAEISYSVGVILAFIAAYFIPRRTNVDHDSMDLSGK